MALSATRVVDTLVIGGTLVKRWDTVATARRRRRPHLLPVAWHRRRAAMATRGSDKLREIREIWEIWERGGFEIS